MTSVFAQHFRPPSTITRRAIWNALACAVTILATRYFFIFYLNMTLGQMLSFFCLVPLLLIWVISSFVYSFASLLIDLKKCRVSMTSILPIVILLAAALSYRIIDINPSALVYGIYGHQYREAAALIEVDASERWKSMGGYVELPDGYRHLSHYGKAHVSDAGEARQVLFRTTTGAIDSFCGILYRSDDKLPELVRDYGYGGPPGEGFRVQQQLDDHWYQVCYAH